MAVYNRSNPLSRQDVADLFLTPVEQESLAFQTCTVLRTDGYELRIPTVLAEPSVGFYAESAEITSSDPASESWSSSRARSPVSPSCRARLRTTPRPPLQRSSGSAWRVPWRRRSTRRSSVPASRRRRRAVGAR